MRIKASNRYTNSGNEVDPSRPVKDCLAIVTWKPDRVDSGNASAGGAVMTFECLVDIDQNDFKHPTIPGEYELPQEGDIFQILEEYQGNDRVQISEVGGDASARIFFYCVQPE